MTGPINITSLRRAAGKAALAVEQRNQAIRDAHQAGATVRAIAAEVGLSFQRVHQILHGK